MKDTSFGLLLAASMLSALVLTPSGAFARGQTAGSGSTDQSSSSCRPTIPADATFAPPAPYPSQAPYAGNVWYGTDRLWTMLRVDGTWRGLPRNADGFRQKVFWWHPGFDGRAESRPDLTVTGRRLDGSESFVVPAPATNAHHVDFGGWTILTGIDVPTGGCWQITGRYRGHTLTFVVRIEP